MDSQMELSKNFNGEEQTKLFRLAHSLILDIHSKNSDQIPKIIATNIAKQIGIDTNIVTVEDFKNLCSNIEILSSSPLNNPKQPSSKEFSGMSKKKLSDLARIINPNTSIKWKSKSLLQASKHIFGLDFFAKQIVEKKLITSVLEVYELSSVTPSSNNFIDKIFSDNNRQDFVDVIKNLSDHQIIMVGRELLKELASQKTIICDKTPSNPLAIDSTILFTFCSIFSVKLNFEDSIEDVQHSLIKTLLSCSSSGSHIFFQFLKNHNFGRSETCDCKINYINRIDQISRSTSAAVSISSSAFQTFKPKQQSRLITIDPTISSILQLIHPDTPGCAIALAASFFKINLSFADCPISEYYKLVMDILRCEQNAPIDILSIWEPLSNSSSTLFKHYIECPQMLALNQLWMPQFRRFYSTQEIQYLAVSEGFEIQNIGHIDAFIADESLESAAQILRITRLEDASNARKAFSSLESALDYAKYNGTILFGVVPEVENEFSPIYYNPLVEEVVEKGSESVVCFQFLDIASRPRCIGITIEDLIEILNNSGAFVIPYTSEHDMSENYFMTKRMVKRLKFMCSHVLKSTSAKSSIQNIWAILDKTMKTITDEKTVKLHSLTSMLSSLRFKEKEEAIAAAVALKDAGMYMRGWKISSSSLTTSTTESIDMVEPPLSPSKKICGDHISSLPLDSSQTTYDPSLQPLVDINVTESLNILSECFSKPGGQCIASFPLLKKHQYQGSLFYTPMLRRDQGFTVQDRISIIRNEGVNDENPYSCIRMSSNLILATAYFILCALNRDPGFSINQMSIIF